jgi:hypothetical protein
MRCPACGAVELLKYFPETDSWRACCTPSYNAQRACCTPSYNAQVEENINLVVDCQPPT